MVHGPESGKSGDVVAAGISGVIGHVVRADPHHQGQAGGLIRAAGGDGDGVGTAAAKGHGRAANAIKAPLDQFRTSAPVQFSAVIGNSHMGQAGADGILDDARYAPAAFTMAFHHLPHGPGNIIPDPATMTLTPIVC